MSSDFSIPFELPNGWEVPTVEDLVTREILEKPLDGNHGGIHPKSSDYVDTGVPFIMASDLENGQVNLAGCKFITTAQANTLRKGFAKTGDVLLSHKATIGRTAIVQESIHDFIVLTPQVTYYRVKNNTQLKNQYLKCYFDSYYFQSILNQWAGAGSTRAYLGITGQLKLPIILPPPDVQQSISKFVKGFDKKIQLNRQINQTLEQIAQAIFKSWFVDFDPVKAKIEAKQNGRDPERAAMCAINGKTDDELGQLYANQREQLAATAALFPDEWEASEKGMLPKGWAFKPLYETAQFINGAAFKSKDFSLEKKGLPIIRIAELKAGITGQTKFTIQNFPEKYLIDDDSVLYSWSGSPKTSLEVFKWFGGKGWLNQHIFKILTDSKPQKLFVYFLLRQLKPTLISIATDKQTTGLGHVTVADMKRLLIPFPNEEVLSCFGDIVGPLYEKASNLEKQSKVLVGIRDALLPKLLSGELNVSQ